MLIENTSLKETIYSWSPITVKKAYDSLERQIRRRIYLALLWKCII